jgi:hypothetical protein
VIPFGEANPETNDLSECLKPFAGEELRLETNDLQGMLIIPDEVCQAVVEYYAFTHQRRSQVQGWS